MADLTATRPVHPPSGRPGRDRAGRSATPPIDRRIGPLFVAWNGLGVSLVDARADDAEPSRRATAPRPDARRSPRTPCRRSARPGHRAPAGRRHAGSASTWTCVATAGFEQDVWRKALEIPRGRGPAVRLGRRRDRPAQGRPGRGDRAGPQPGPAHRALPSRGPDRRHDRPVLAGRAGATSGRSCAAEGLDPEAHGGRCAAAASGSSGRATTNIVCWPIVPHRPADD